MGYRLLLGDSIKVLQTLDAGSVQTCVTSPPFYGLRDYGTATWEGGDPACDHTISHADADGKAVFAERVHRGSRLACLRCGALRVDAQIGLEETPEAYVENLVAAFREVRRVLRADGTVWLNLGDSYSGSANSGGVNKNDGGIPHRMVGLPTKKGEGIKPKDLIGIPWMVAFALRADGWWLRSDIIWHKPNPMPESVRDRPTKAHEYIFLLSKSSRYYYDGDAIREPLQTPEHMRGKEGYGQATKNHHAAAQSTIRNGMGRMGENPNGRNKRSVWTVTTKPYKGAHFATFPPALIEPCVLAGSKAGDVVLDPFNGSGTTGLVSIQHGRNFIGIDLKAEYIALAHERIGKAKYQPRLLIGD